MSDKKKVPPHRGRRKKRKSGLVSNLILIVALAIFGVSAFQLVKIGKGYVEGRSEYKDVADLVIDEKKEGFKVDFDELMKINEDTIGWIRFNPEPAIINYPMVQGKDNQEYLKKTFKAGENAMGAIFIDVNNQPNFTDKNTIVYGHRMKDGSMFRKLSDYEDQAFLQANPYFYIYTPDGKELTYQVFAAGKVKDTSEVYTTQFASDEMFATYIDKVKSGASYDTGVQVKADATIVTLSTCTAQSDDNRFVLCGVKVKESRMEE